MKKLLMVVAVLATSSLALAAPTFVLPAQIDLTAGVPVDVYVGVTNLADAGGIQGMNLYLGTGAPLVLTNLQILDITGGIFTSTNANVPSLLDALDPQTWESSLSVKSGVITASGNVAKITITAPLGSEGLVSALSTDITGSYGVASDFAGIEAVQATAVVKVIPEPTSLLLLIAGLPLLRRRHA